MKKIILAGLIIGLLMFGMGVPANADTYTFLDHYAVTHNTDDVVHLGDDYLPGFIVPAHQGDSEIFNFLLPAAGVGNLTLNISHYQSEQANHISLNGYDIGYLSNSPVSQDWVTESFNYAGDILMSGNNTLTVYAAHVPAGVDDYEFTNLSLDYELAVVPEPISSTLFIVGGATLGFRRFRKKFKK